MRIWNTKHCNKCNTQTHHKFVKVEKILDGGYPEVRYFEYYCMSCNNLTETYYLDVCDNKRSPDYGCNEAQIEHMNQCRYNGENFRNWITLVDQMRNERNKNN
jgi:hypothetical protein